MEEERTSIYKSLRSIKQKETSLLYNALRSIYEDSVFVREISAGVWPDLPLVANLRCGLWYAPPSLLHSTCYFKSTDGHTNNLSFSTARLNLHVASLAADNGGCIIVDSTRKGKRFPDSMSKTIPIWACVINRAVARRSGDGSWDCELHLPLWVSDSERSSIEKRLDEWSELFEACGADVPVLKKPLRPLWVSQNTLIWLNQVPSPDSWDFTPIILLSASQSSGGTAASEFSWRYIPGAGDDEESWSRGLTPALFWENAYDLVDSGPELCNQKVAQIVERDRVYRAQRGLFAPQVKVKAREQLPTNDCNSQLLQSCMSTLASAGECPISWIGSTNIAVSASFHVGNVSDDVDCVLNCDSNSISFSSSSPGSYMHLPIVTSKMDRFSLLNSLPLAINFAKLNLSKQKKLLICCQDGKDISTCVCLAILTALFDERGTFDVGNCFLETSITKWEMRKRLVFICNFAVNAQPSRGNLRQVFAFLSKEKDSSPSVNGLDCETYVLPA